MAATDIVRIRVPRGAPLAERFWSKVDMADGCWLWTASLDAWGYGTIKIGAKVVKAHRVSFSLSFGEAPADLCVLHRCDTPACVRPSHLFLGTQGDNVADRVRKGRTYTGDQRGDSNNNAKITMAIADAIRARHAAGDITQAALAREYGISKGTVYDLLIGRTWAA